MSKHANLPITTTDELAQQHVCFDTLAGPPVPGAVPAFAPQLFQPHASAMFASASRTKACRGPGSYQLHRHGNRLPCCPGPFAGAGLGNILVSFCGDSHDDCEEDKHVVSGMCCGWHQQVLATDNMSCSQGKAKKKEVWEARLC